MNPLMRLCYNQPIPISTKTSKIFGLSGAPPLKHPGCYVRNRNGDKRRLCLMAIPYVIQFTMFYRQSVSSLGSAKNCYRNSPQTHMIHSMSAHFCDCEVSSLRLFNVQCLQSVISLSTPGFWMNAKEIHQNPDA